MCINKRRLRTWTAFPAVILFVALSVIVGPAANSAYTTQVSLAPVLPVGITAAHIPLAVVTLPRLPSTSTSNAYEPLKPVNFVQGFALGFALVLIGWLLLLESRKSA